MMNFINKGNFNFDTEYFEDKVFTNTEK